MTARRVGVFGGTFDPMHRGHIDIGQAAQSALGLTDLFVVPASVPPHRDQPHASSYHRFAMVALAVAGRPGWHASDLELCDRAPSFTSATLKRFHERGYAASELFFVIGADAFADIGSWKDYPDLLDCAHFAVVSRPGCPVAHLPARLPLLASRMVAAPLDRPMAKNPAIVLIDAPTSDVSASAIRRRRAAGQSIAGLVDPAVQQHIEQHGLYSSLARGERESDETPGPAAGRLRGQG